MRSIIIYASLCFTILTANAATNQAKHNNFNDSNYRPRGAVNVVPAVKPRPNSNKKSSKPAKATSSTKVNWSWPSSNGKQTSSGVFVYLQSDGRIDTNTVCNNYQYGSFLYRDCRKAAKQYFSRQCTSGTNAACVAAGMTP